ncbi:MAG: thioredoxin family protein [Candidatus Limnocylindria bacterium]
MTVTAERFATGMTYDDFKAAMTRNKDRFEENERAVEISAEDRVALARLARPLKVLVLAEDWCGDVIANLPVLGRLAQETGRLDLRVFPRDANPDLMDMYLNQGKYRSIPVFAFFDDDFREIGRFTERPASVTMRRAAQRREIYASDDAFGNPDSPVDQLSPEVREKLTQRLQAGREDLAPFANREVIREILEIVERAPA